MENPVATALVISLLGMPLLFLALTFFYGLLSLMTSTLQGRLPGPLPSDVEGGREDDGEGVSLRETEALLEAAAVAVAIARAEADHSPALGGRGVEVGTVSQPISAWWALHHQRQTMPGWRGRRSR